MRKKIILSVVSLILILIVAAVFLADSYIASFSQNYCYDEVEKIPEKKVALILGTSPVAASGRTNSFYKLRIDAAEVLYNAKKVQHFLVSGDNSTKEYDEPTCIRNDLIKRGIPAEIIYRDYAGFRTLDSIIRANRIFSLNDFIVVSQKFHNERAVFLARTNGLNAFGYNALLPDNGRIKASHKLRELLARAKAILDVFVLSTKPKFLGDKIEIGKTSPE
ncbi:MAG: YdcF family protein [Candidatus Riflebacteria bacterium]|nr:YdcF family protein [Candidatus Riflebacteria bacterium]